MVRRQLPRPSRRRSMFDTFGKKLQTFFLILIIGLLTVVMGVVGFGNPNAEGCNLEGAPIAATVYGETITKGEFEAGLRLLGVDQMTVEQQRAGRRREYMLD